MIIIHQASLFLLLVFPPCIVCGFAVLTSTNLDARKDSRIFSQKRFVQPTNEHEDIKPLLNDARTKRIVLPLQLITSLLLIHSSPAHAGIGAVVPFDATRQEKFQGSIKNSVVMLRLNSTLRKRGYRNKNAVVATLKSKDDLSLDMAQSFGSFGKAVSLGDSSSFAEYIQNCQDKKALVLYGQDVSISPEGNVSDIQGKDLKSSEKTIMDSLASKGLSDLTLVGGIVIHRVKSGGKDAGEDYFYPMSITSVRNGVTTDLFKKVFGDLPTPRQSVILPG